ncbi:NAD(P)-dependent dehydrogenase, short-chain alcohol dehydrogenase family [Zobellia uliginosa]|uniref:NAD(P)-dependent dehydrogenase, short-chain alcohol dehydrogenase family n=1 Tax=Zobellia uliginosa TaxID=143224 RepID=A0ABY1KS52_9FLAO|nr:SDR family oxidoreductase [Zobellia uliginosa]SIS70769.1 NAD(P)-dependent dehydrogenase, short-chain alcohol dehydrogenase family [Zobellia uliginosa]
MEQWVLILGGSSGLGLATAKKMAAHGYSICIVHRDRKLDLEEINSHFQKITSTGVRLLSFNVDVVNAERRRETIEEVKRVLSPSGKIKVLVHSIAKGSLKPMLSDEGPGLNRQDIEITLNAMALSLYDWTKEVYGAGLFDKDARILAFTSEGSSRAWEGYAAVSAAKASLEALVRSIALEYAPKGIKANCIQAGTTDTKAFRMIPNSEVLKENAVKRNPNGRLTLPEDVAKVVYLLSTDEAQWITGTVIKVDGGESLR